MDDGAASASIIVLFFVLLFIEAILNGFEKAVTLVDVKAIEEKATSEKDKKSIYLMEILERSNIYTNSTQMIITLNHLIMGCFYLPRWSLFFARWFDSLSMFDIWHINAINILAVIVACACLMYVILTFAMLLPKKLATRKPDNWAYTFIGGVRFIKSLLYPLTGIIAKSANGILILLGLKESDEQTDVTEEEIISMVNEGHEQGVLEASEAEMITNIFEFGDKEAGDIMTNRSNINAIDANMPLLEALNYMLSESNSRYPVFEENLDHIIGVLYLKDAMRMHNSDEALNRPIGKIKGLVRDAVFVPETKNIDDLFKIMQSEKNQMAIVMDEYGQTSGLVTMEDILEEIVGNIMDEYDAEEETIQENGKDEYLIDGMTRLEDLEDKLDIDFGECEFETLNGFLISLIDKIPDENDEYVLDYDGYQFKIMNVEKNVIQSVLVTKLSQEHTDQQETVTE